MPPRLEQARNLVEERDHVRVRDEVERAVREGERGRIGELEVHAAGELRRELPARLGDHPLREIRSRHVRLRKATRERERAAAGSGAEVEGSARRRRQLVERPFVRREVPLLEDRVPARGQRLELPPRQRTEEAPQARVANDCVRRQPRELLPQLLPVHGTFMWIRKSWPSRAPNICPALPPLMA